MNILSLESVSKNYGIKPLFEDVRLGFEDTDRVGIIGANGAGKTTFLRVAAGLEPPDTGRVVRAGGKTLAFLAQNPEFDDERTVLETVFAAETGVIKLIRDYETACRELERDAGNRKLLERVSRLQHELEISGGWEAENNARNVLTKLGVTDTSARMKTLSGGQRKRVALARELILKPDILILDEPTNHLDADTIAWLEDYLKRYAGALLLVTHDRYFLDRVTNRILEIDRGRVQSFNGNYAFYLEKKEEQETLRAVEDQKRRQLIKKELAWLRRGAKARTRKSKIRVEAAYELINQPREKARAEIDIAIGAKRLGSKIIELHGISKSYGGQKLVENFSYTVKRGDRIGIIGANGSGKTTLLEMIAGRALPDAGEIVVGETVRIGYYDQESRALDENKRVIDYIREQAEYVTTADGRQITASQMLDKFLFPPAAQYAFIGHLSGGERRRLYLLRVLMAEPNVLLLDEPTNDLDIPTLIALEEYLEDFPGVLIAVSHDRYFLDRTAESIFRFEGNGRVREFAGDYTAYLETVKREEAEKAAENTETGAPAKAETNASKTPEKARPQKLSFKEKRELEALETEIAETENRLAAIERELNEYATDAYRLSGLVAEQEELNEKLDRLLTRWTELAERANL